MFELIGMAVVAWVAWSVLKAILAVARKRTTERAVMYAAARGVPYEVSEEFLEHQVLVKEARRNLARKNEEFATLDLYEQYGKALIALHAGRQEILGEDKVAKTPVPWYQQYALDKEAKLEQTKNRVQILLEPQILALKAEGSLVTVDYITFAYVGALAWATTKFNANASEVRSIVEHCFQGKQHAREIENAWGLIDGNASELKNTETILADVAEHECAAGKGEYFEKFTRKGNRNGGLATGSMPDLSKVNDDWFLDV